MLLIQVIRGSFTFCGHNNKSVSLAHLNTATRAANRAAGTEREPSLARSALEVWSPAFQAAAAQIGSQGPFLTASLRTRPPRLLTKTTNICKPSRKEVLFLPRCT